MEKSTKEKDLEITIGMKTSIKYLIGIAIILLAFSNGKQISFLINALIEFSLIVVISEILISKYKKIGSIISKIIYCFFCIQILVKYYASSFLQIVMLTNLDSIEDISGKAITYVISIIVVFISIFLPHNSMGYLFEKIHDGKKYKSLVLLLAVEIVFTSIFGYDYSPYAGYVDLTKQYIADIKKKNEIKNTDNCTKDFYKPALYHLAQDDTYISDRPNVVLVITEGLSQSIIDDERDITSNIRKYENKSVDFINYFNHTFPTYRGISGQLYSGYQLDNYDENTLVSIQSVLKKRGYKTLFINTEPQNIDFTAYLNNLGFDDVYSDIEKEYGGAIGSVSDKEAYNLLFNKIEEYDKSDDPFLIVIYTFGTHASLDSPHKVYGDGKNAELNKFYNMDYQFGKFMKKWNKSECTDDTILAFTTDHATYADISFYEAFPDYNRENVELDRVPFFIYHKNITPLVVDAAGRNSLDLVPTLLDYINISEENYFLGETLFMVKDNNNGYDTSFTDGSNYYDTTDGVISDMSDVKKEILVDHITKYYSAKLQEPLK